MYWKLKSEFGVFLPLLVLLQISVQMFRVSGLHNSQLLIDVGEKVIQRANPYIPMQPYGAFPGLVYWVINLFSFGFNSPIIFLLLNLFGIFALISFLLPDLKNKKKLSIFSILLFTAPIRALEANVQHTGIIFGSLVIGDLLYKSAANNKHPLLRQCIAILFFLLAFEIKPQIALPFIFIWLIQERVMNTVYIILAEIISIHILIDIWVGRILEFDHLKVWLYMKNDSLTISEQTSFWKLLQMQDFIQLDWFKFSFGLYGIGLILLIYFVLRKPNVVLLRWAILLPTATAYLHLYDLVVFAIVVCYWAVLKMEFKGAIFSLGLITIPSRFNSLSEIINGLVFIFAVSLIIYLNQKEEIPQNKKVRFIELILAFLSILIISRLTITLEEKVSIQVTIMMIIVIIWVNRNRYHSRRINIPEPLLL